MVCTGRRTENKTKIKATTGITLGRKPLILKLVYTVIIPIHKLLVPKWAISFGLVLSFVNESAVLDLNITAI